MNQALVVYAHPEPRSFTAALRETVVAGLAGQGYGVEVSDLYAMGFNPVLSREDFLHETAGPALAYTREQRFGFRNGSLAPDIAAEAGRVLAADLLVLVFPVYWFDTPAILKGWFDRVLLSGPMYGGRQMYDGGGMTGRRALVVASLGGRPHMFGPGAVHGELGTGMLSHLLRGTLGVLGYRVLEPFFAYHAPFVSDEARAGMLDDLGRQIAGIETRAALPMPSLADYDETLRPK